MGLYRLVLAILVAVSHAGVVFGDYNPGIVAVISFFILSGYVMTMLINKYYAGKKVILAFYLDRVARLFPQYILYLVITTLVIYYFEISDPFVERLTTGKWLLNLLIVPMGYYMYWAEGAMVIPQAWSLGLELTFYLAFPWIIIYLSARQVYGLAALSFGIFVAAYLGVINTAYFGYRLLPGTLFMFLLGWSFNKKDTASSVFAYGVVTAASAMLLFSHYEKNLYELPYNKEVLLGLITGFWLIKALKKYKFSWVDEFLGNLSYGVFLNHFIIIWLMQKYLKLEAFGVLHVSFLVVSSCLMAFISFLYVERPALKLRRQFRLSQ